MKLEFHKNNWAVLVDENGKKITGKTWLEVQQLVFELSKKYNQKIMVMPVKRAFELMKIDKDYKKLMEDYWTHNNEIFVEELVKGKELHELLDLPEKYCGRMRFENGLSSVRSFWYAGGGWFVALSSGPSGRIEGGFVAVFQVEKVPELEKREEIIDEIETLKFGIDVMKERIEKLEAKK